MASQSSTATTLPAKMIECSAQPMDFSFHARQEVVVTGLVDGTMEVHRIPTRNNGKGMLQRLHKSKREKDSDSDDDDDDEDEEEEKEEENDHDNAEMEKQIVDEEENDDSNDENMEDSETETLLGSLKLFSRKNGSKTTMSCRAVRFDGRQTSKNDSNVTLSSNLLFAGSGGECGELCCIDVERISKEEDQNINATNHAVLWRVGGGLGTEENGANQNSSSSFAAMSRLYQLPSASPAGPLLVTGNDAGGILLWDARQNPKRGTVMEWQQHDDYISDFATNVEGTTLLATSADGTLSVYDLRKQKSTPLFSSGPTPDSSSKKKRRRRKKKSDASTITNTNSSKPQFVRQSDYQDDELLSLAIMKQGRKVVVGSHEGVLNIWSWGTWGDVSDRFPGHPQSVDALLPVDNANVLLTGSVDGYLRVVSVQPNKLLGIWGSHDGFPIERLSYSAERRFVASLSHDVYVRLWDAKPLFDDDDDSDDGNDNDEEDGKKEGENESVKKTQVPMTATSRTARESDDEWEDEDDEEEAEEGDEKEEEEKERDSDNDDSDDDDDDDYEKNAAAKKSRFVFPPTENERFFKDL